MPSYTLLFSFLLIFLLVDVNSFSTIPKVTRRNLKLSIKMTTQSNNSFKEIISATALVSGTTVGAGILALPTVALQPGFIPSSLALIACWVYMSITGLLIAEVNTNLHKNNDINNSNSNINSQQIGIISMVGQTLGNKAQVFSSIIYVFIHYSLLIAYIAEAGGILTNTLHLSAYAWSGPLLFTTLLGSLFTFGPSAVEGVNNLFVLAVLLSFFGLVGAGLSSMDLTNLNLIHQDYQQLLPALPVILVALVYHNIVPTICSQLKYTRKDIIISVAIGSLIPLIMFVLWDFLILDLLPSAPIEAADSTQTGAVDYYTTTTSTGGGGSGSGSTTGGTVTQFNPIDLLLSSTSNTPSGEGSNQLGPLLSIFSESAVITSFIGFVYGLTDFFCDLYPSKLERTGDWKLNSLVLLPPLLIACTYPNIFNDALALSGTYGTSTLFCIYPALMALAYRSQRTTTTTASSATTTSSSTSTSSSTTTAKSESESGSSRYVSFVPGGPVVLYGVIAVAGFIIVQETLRLVTSS